ncbi:hypothetical protein VPNG_07420 [Cytospora leucostoma]|uniref:Prolyl 4-hydroxylase alpha subunit Fe(2+) 2OG dioxygenase domain-containing protein n=1 Tax=Cytospora leucostoma TaxID=1230097 RepID=A0A423WMK4_9PEZI|nr:hypothetical protein VPNG_07420 [Cytospora leucostoma]
MSFAYSFGHYAGYNYNGLDSALESEEEVHQRPELVAWKQDLAEGLKAVQFFGDFATQKNYSQFVNPGLEVADCPIPLPLISLFADQIKAVSRPAPFGRGDETVVDHSVRLTWELNTTEFRNTNPAWPKFLDTIKQDAAHSLGLSPASISIDPHKLLLYETGSFFKRHKDSEKAPGMIGSLIICLPSKHEGGEVHLSHAGRDHIYATAPSSAFDITALAWYSDVTHEVKEVTAGHRLVLTYNIIQSSGAGKSAGFFVQQQAQLKEKIARWSTDFPDLSKLVYFLDHKYSQSSLSPINLKGRDRAVFEVLQQLCSESGFYLLLGNVTKKKYEFDYGFNEEKPGIFLEYLCTLDGKRIATDLLMTKNDIIGSDPYRHRSADSEDEGELTGNESTPNLYRYHDSAIVLIPRDKLQTLMDTNADRWAILTMVLDKFRKNQQDADVRRHALEIMHKTLDTHCPPTKFYGQVPTVLPAWHAISMVILTSGWKLGDFALYNKAIRACTAGGDISDVLVAKLADLIEKSSSIPQPPDWDKLLGELLERSIDLTRLFTALEGLETALVKKSSKDALKAWVAPKRRTKFETKTTLTPEDLPFIVGLVTSLFIPKLHDCQDKALVGKIIGTLAEKGRESTPPGAETIAQQILDFELPRLYLGPMDWWMHPEESGDNEAERFLNLLEICLKSGFIDHAADLVTDLNKLKRQQIWDKPTGFGGLGFAANIAQKFVLELGDLLNEHQAPFMESVRGVFEHLLRNYALAPFPVYPTFSPLRQTAQFAKAKNIRDHISLRLPGKLFSCSLDTRGRPHTLVVTKHSQDVDYQDALQKYRERVQTLGSYTEKLKHEHFRRILGGELYRELILLEGPPGSGPPGAAPQQGVVHSGGIKREADDELSRPPARRRGFA